MLCCAIDELVMPIRPEMMSRYPGGSIKSREWRSIRSFILQRANNRCEQCRVENYDRIRRGKNEDEGTFMRFDGSVYDDSNGERLGWADMSSYEGYMVDIVLTIAHLDHNPANNVAGNLKALCQQCHNRYDAEPRRQTRRSKNAIGDLFDSVVAS